METLIGRETERKLLEKVFDSGNPELVAIYGRRRVGKTFLIRTAYSGRIIFEFSGIHSGNMDTQLQNFTNSMTAVNGSPVNLAVPDSWLNAFHQLQTILQPKIDKGRSVIFFDEFPWANSARSGFLAAFEHFWNSWCTKQNNLVVIICGSAAAWMIRNVVNNKGGLHNRISQKIRLLPFSLYETEQYLKSNHVNLDQYQILQIYMAIGGVPQYLKNIKPGQSAAAAIDELCFTKDGFLRNEFDNLYRSLFDKPDSHINVIKALAAKTSGLTRNEIITACALSSGGTTTKLIEELVESGFITPYIPFNKDVKDSIYKLTDEYSLFYLKFMTGRIQSGTSVWLKMSTGSSWKSWSGFAFEDICLKHITQIKSALGIAAVNTQESVWRYIPGKGEKGAQIDLLIDRQDNCINICEMKFSTSVFTIDPSYGMELKNKLNVFREKTKTKKTLFLTMLTTHGVKQNSNYLGVVQQDLEMNILFSP
jgi:AAA+ ATPase superfamily predicted ATPase